MMVEPAWPCFVGISIGLGVFLLSLGVLPKSKSAQKQGKIEVDITTNDPSIAIGTLRKMGWTKKEAEEAVKKALSQCPNGGYEKLINIAVRL